MPTNFTMRQKTASGYETLYPKTVPEQIITNENNRFVTDAEKSAWNANASKTPTVYGTCATAAATAAKTVTATGFALAAGAMVSVTFAYDVPASATLNVDSTGAKNIQCQKANIKAGVIKAGDTALFVYTGSYWYVLAVDKSAADLSAPTYRPLGSATWAEVNEIAQAGLAPLYWSIGDTRQVTLSTSEVITVRIEDFGHDTLTAGGTAKMTLGMVECLNTTRQMNTSNNTNVGGWGSSAIRTFMTTLLGQLPSDLQAVIKSVTKKASAGNLSTSLTTTDDKLWLFSYTEVNLPVNASYSPGGEGTAYPLFISDAARIKKVNGTDSNWWLRSPPVNGNAGFCNVNNIGKAATSTAMGARGVTVGFCI